LLSVEKRKNRFGLSWEVLIIAGITGSIFGSVKDFSQIVLQSSGQNDVSQQ
jgi:hypothetical protein